MLFDVARFKVQLRHTYMRPCCVDQWSLSSLALQPENQVSVTRSSSNVNKMSKHGWNSHARDEVQFSYNVYATLLCTAVVTHRSKTRVDHHTQTNHLLSLRDSLNNSMSMYQRKQIDCGVLLKSDSCEHATERTMAQQK